MHLFAQDSVSLVGNSFLSISSPHLQQVVVLCLSGADLIAGHDMYCGSERSVHSSGEKTLIASRRPLLRSSVVAVPLKKRIPRMSPETTDEERKPLLHEARPGERTAPFLSRMSARPHRPADLPYQSSFLIRGPPSSGV